MMPDVATETAPRRHPTVSNDELLRRAVQGARASRRIAPQGAPRWVAVMNLFQLGASTAIDLCESFGINPDERLPP